MLFESARDVKRLAVLLTIQAAVFLALHLFGSRWWQFQVDLIVSILIFFAAVWPERNTIDILFDTPAALVAWTFVLSVFVKLGTVFGTLFLWALIQRAHYPWWFMMVPLLIDGAVLVFCARMVGDDDDTSGAVRPAK